MMDKRSIIGVNDLTGWKNALDRVTAENESLRKALKQKTMEADYNASLLQMLRPEDEQSLASIKALEASAFDWERKYNDAIKSLEEERKKISEIRDIIGGGCGFCDP